ncbi:hypothetical protein [Phytohabitans aurantiacus]|uniref:Uncharacterized protein n=1 Tax=Phytohabitans aurantiacus TaxID=3016789 RepID=A0ABQ5QYU6_9ACTN|nr:hypothetical protein [Phytohabitans aurantiacus]GLH99334.1 hypothetical protein Pa4123_46090 [Phytohabitans aurantiacus]
MTRWYQLLLHAYPRWYRRERGAEMLTTLLDAAEPGQRRPHPRDALDLLLGGVRCRFALPRRPMFEAHLAYAALVAAFVGLATAAAIGVLAWPTAAPAPDAVAARAAADTAMPFPLSGSPTRYDAPLELGYGDEAAPRELRPGSARIEYSYVPPAGETFTDSVAEAHRRLAAAGWQVHPIRPGDHTAGFWGSRDDQVILVRGYSGVSGTDPLQVAVYGQAARWMTALVGVAACAGFATGWLLAAWTLRRFWRHGLRGRLVAALFVAPGLLVAGVALLAGAYEGLVVGLENGWAPNDSLFAAAALDEAGPLAGIGAAGLLLASLVLAMPARPGPPSPVTSERVWRYGLWTMTGAHLAFALAWGTVVGLFLAHGRRLVDADGPMDLIPFGYHPMNPFMWLYAILAMLYLFGFLASPALLSVSVPLLVTGRRVAHAAGLRTAWLALLLAALTALALPIATSTSLGHDATAWWSD